MNVEPANFSSPNPTERAEAASTEMPPLPITPVYPSNSSDASPQDKIQSDPKSAETQLDQIQPDEIQPTALVGALLQEYQAELPAVTAQVRAVVTRIAVEVERVCSKSDRIQTSGDIAGEKMYLAGLRMQRCLNYYRLGSRQGRVELHSHLSTVVYRHIAPQHAQLGFAGRYTAIEDFLQSFYIEVVKAFRRENQLAHNYQPQTRLELAEYMTFTELYAKRRIVLPGQRKQQLVVLRAQSYANRQPPEAALDLEMAMESAKGEEGEMHSRSPVVQQVREQMVSDVIDPTDSVIRDRVITELIEYLEEQGQENCVKYLVLKLKDCSAPEIDEILELSSRERDYLQQRFKYHVEKFAKSHRWQLVHQWLGADIDQNLGLSQPQWQHFVSRLSPDELYLLELKGKQTEDAEIAKLLKCTAKQLQKRWVRLLDQAWQVRNGGSSAPALDA
jgi:hypothetical protein